jgi:BlaI family transcriptional regulator, penicillinase repressor
MGNETGNLSRFEMEVMDVLWKLGRASVREIHEQLPAREQPAYTTVQTIVTRLLGKGAVRQVRKIGNAHIYEPAVARESAHRRLINDLIERLGGSVRPLMAHLVESKQISLEDVKELERAVREMPAGRKPKKER